MAQIILIILIYHKKGENCMAKKQKERQAVLPAATGVFEGAGEIV